MSRLELGFKSGPAGAYPVCHLRDADLPPLTIPIPVECRYLGGGMDSFLYPGVAEDSSGVVSAGVRWSHSGVAFALSDR